MSDPRLSGLLQRWQEAYERGQDLPAADLCRDCPELIPVVARQLELLRQSHRPTAPAVDDATLVGLDTRSWVVPAMPDPEAAPPAAATDSGTMIAPAGFVPPEVAHVLGKPEEPGELGRFGGCRVLKLLGQGGMGSVFAAEEVSLKRVVALKILRPELSAYPEMKQRFLREAQAAASLHHDHIIPVYRVGEERGVSFLVMPLLEGETLEERLKREPRLPLDLAVKLAAELAEGLAAAHAKKLIHRDIKPANLWLEGPVGNCRRLRILDFGLARHLAGNDRVTVSGMTVGTPAYMAPEQADGESVDARADLFSLGVVLYRMSTGVSPFEKGNILGTLMALANEKPKPPAQLNPAIPPALSELILQLIEKDPAKRFGPAEAVAERLRSIPVPSGPAAPTGATPPPVYTPPRFTPMPFRVPPAAQTPPVSWRPQPVSAPATATPTPPRPPVPQPQPQRSGGMMGLLVGVALLALAAGGVWYAGREFGWFGNPANRSSTEARQPNGSEGAGEIKPAGGGLAEATELRAGQPLTNSLGMSFVWVPAGEFVIGSPDKENGHYKDEGQHLVKFARPFWMGRCEVTRGQFARFVRSANYRTEAEQDGQGGWGFDKLTGRMEGRKPEFTWRNTGFEQTDDHPVVNVTYNDALAFCRWLSKETGQDYRLPREAEWEYACRAGTQTPFWNGSDPQNLVRAGNVLDADAHGQFPDRLQALPGRDGYVFTAPVGKFAANAWGLHDTIGNVREWCLDWYGVSYADLPDTDPERKEPAGETRRVIRGGGWDSPPKACRSADRGQALPDERSYNLGFRVLLVAPAHIRMP